MATIIREASNNLLLVQEALAANASTFLMYGSVERADNYFEMMLEAQRWHFADRLNKLRALVSATRRIDRLNFVGDKADSSQSLQFPRGTDTTVPVEVEQACYELALALLKGVDPDTEHDNLQLNVQAYGGLRSEMDRSYVLPYLVAGIPSASAWDLLLPWIQANTGIELRRIS